MHEPSTMNNTQSFQGSCLRQAAPQAAPRSTRAVGAPLAASARSCLAKTSWTGGKGFGSGVWVRSRVNTRCQKLLAWGQGVWVRSRVKHTRHARNS